MIASPYRDQYAAGCKRISYHVLPSSRVWPLGRATKRNSPRRERKYPSRCGGAMSAYGLHSCIGLGCESTLNDNRRPGSHRVIGSTKAPVENTQRRTAPTPSPTI